jgi:NAD-reducing hydrogenase small subunit
MAKVKVETAWLDSCSGCHMSFLDLDEALINLVDKIEFGASPITDFKHFTPCDLGILEGSISNEHDEEVARELRENCKILLVLGDCACFGGINNMRNLFPTQDVMARYYATESTTPGSATPKSKELPGLFKVKPVNQVVKVDCYIPGCPPTAGMILYGLTELLEGRIPVVPGEIMRFD